MSHNKQKVIQALEKYGDSLMRVAFTYTNNMDDAQDMVQEAFLRYIRKAPAFESQEHEKAWLIRVVVNICKNYVNSAYKKGYTPLDETLPANDTYSSGLWEGCKYSPRKIQNSHTPFLLRRIQSERNCKDYRPHRVSGVYPTAKRSGVAQN